MYRWKQQQIIYSDENRGGENTVNKRHAWNIWEAWFHGHPSFFFFLSLVCFSAAFIPHLSLSFSSCLFPSSLYLHGSSVWLFIGNDSHCGRAPLRLRSPFPPLHPSPSFSPICHALFMASQSNEGTTVGSRRHGAWLFLPKSPPRCPSLVPTITHSP